MTTRNDKCFYVYIISSLSGTLYVGLTDDLNKRLQEHRDGVIEGFTKRYKIHRLMYYEIFRDANNADFREQQIKKWRRDKKIALFALSNPRWADLTESSSWLSKDLLM